MADRTVYGLNFSENGWRMVDQGSCVWVRVPGATHVSLQIREGQPARILGAIVADWNAYIEPVRDADSACWTATNSVASSNHLSGTACDVNWGSHPFKIKDAGFSSAQLATMREMLSFYEGMVFWGNDWQSPKDAMHVQMNGNTYGAQNVDRVQDFINRKIRPDGFSTFRRTGMPIAPSSVEILARATGLTVDRAGKLLSPLTDGLKAAECTTVNRIAMYLAQVGHESDNFNATEEYASGDDYDTRTDLGNTPQVDGDGRLYKGRSWIQITGKANYRAFSLWACAKGLVPTPDYFVIHPKELSDLKWAGIGAAWYWTAARPDINALSDRRDLETVTRRINGGLNGLDDRRARYNRALALGDQLLTLLTGEDDVLANPEIEKLIRELHGAMFNLTTSWSSLATPGEGARWALHEKIHSIDGMLHPFHVISRAKAGDLGELHRIVLAAKGQGVDKSPATVAVFQQVLADIEASHPEVLKSYIAQRGTL